MVFLFLASPLPLLLCANGRTKGGSGELPFSLPAPPPPPPVSFARYLLYYSWVTPKEQEKGGREGGDG